MDEAGQAAAAISARGPLGTLAPDMVRLDAEIKQTTHAIRMAACNAETALARALHGHYPRADDEAYALIRQALAASGDICPDGELLIRLDPLTAPRDPGPGRALRPAHRRRRLLSLHRPRPALRGQIPPKPCIKDLPMSGVLRPTGKRVIPMSAELFAVIAAIVRRHTQGGRVIPLIQRYDQHERRMSEPMPFLFQRQLGTTRRVISPATVQVMLRRRCNDLADSHPEFGTAGFTPHDFRRLLATDLVNNGLPIHIGAALLGHLNLQTTRGYVAVFNEDVVRHYQAFLDRRRQARPADEYRTVTQPEWLGFEEHFDQRKVELGGCARPYGTPCQHEHACLRCPMININPKMLPRLDEIEDDLQARRSRAAHEGWLGEIEGIDLTLTFLRQKRDQTRRLARIAPTDLGMPGVLATESP